MELTKANLPKIIRKVTEFDQPKANLTPEPRHLSTTSVYLGFDKTHLRFIFLNAVQHYYIELIKRQ